MPIVTIDGQPLHYLDQGCGPAILLGYSYLWDHTMWTPQIAELSQHYRVIVPDLWGHGASGHLPQTTQTVKDLSRQALNLLDHLDIQRCTLIGLSVGGMWGAQLALSTPERINGLVLMDTYVGAEPEPTKQIYFSLLKQIEESGAITPDLLDVIVPLFFRPGIDPQLPLYREFRASLGALSAERLRQSIVPLGRIIFSRDDLLPQLTQLNPKTTLVVCGDQDTARPPAESLEMVDLIGCPYLLVPDAGHISNLENPAFVTSALLSFLSDRTRPAN